MSLSNSASNQPIPNIFNVKAIAEYLPFFDGDKDQLECFIDRCEKFYNNYGRTTDRNFLMCRLDLTSWPLIKEALREHYGDRIDRQTLTREFLQLNRHRNESIVDFLERLKLMKSQVEVKIQTDESLNDGQKVILMNQNELNTLDVLSANTDDNLRLLLDLKQPNTLTAASDIVIRHFHNEMRINSLSRRQNNNIHTTNKPQFPSQPMNIQPRQIPQKFLTNRQVFGKPNNASNVFSPKNSHKPNHPLEPTSSRNTRFSRNNVFRPSGPPNFIAKELYNAEIGKPMTNQYQSHVNYSQEPHYSKLPENQYTLLEEYEVSLYKPNIDLF
ncbi:hypothetical protein ABEB36_013493 [Hypothenemus hampei]|uniref:Retrotransposon gag domain-containing protein n=1 Tax=Hypothenemus hampei TaxID=57062 RepID=A0ABD1E4K3_HYPHA